MPINYNLIQNCSLYHSKASNKKYNNNYLHQIHAARKSHR